MRCLPILICLLGPVLAVPALAQPVPEGGEAGAAQEARDGRIYRMTDEQGRVIFTDSPPAGVEAREVQPAPSNIMPTPPRSQTQTRQRAAAAEKEVEDYSEIAIRAPAHEQTFQNPQQPIHVQVGLVPALRAGHQLRILHNGEPLPGPQLVQPERGAHTFTAQVLDADGQVVVESEAVTVHVHRPSVLLGPGARRNADKEKGADQASGGEGLVQILPWYPATR